MLRLPACLRPWTSLELDDGDDNLGHVRPCCWALKNVGDANQQLLREIWNGPGYLEYRRRMLSGDLEGLCPNRCPNRMPSSPEKRIYLGQYLRAPSWNQLKNFWEISQGATQLESLPIYAKVAPSLACNLDCIMCYQTHDARIRLPDAVIEDLFSMMEPIRLLRLQGGELFSSKVGLDFLRRLKEIPRQPQIGIITNGTFPIEAGWALLEGLNLKWVIVSLDAATPETYRQIRIGGDWGQVGQNLLRLREMSRSRKTSFNIHLSFTLMTRNYHELSSFIELAARIGADVVLNPLTEDKLTQDLDIFAQRHLQRSVEAELLKARRVALKHGLSLAQSTIDSFWDMWQEACIA